MNTRKTLTVLSIAVILISATACISAVIPGDGSGYSIVSEWGEEIDIHGKGLYRMDSSSYAIQGIAQDWVTLALGIPLLTVSLILFRKNNFRGKLLLTGSLAYFLYTYMSYSFLMTYNPLFLVYVTLFSLSLFGFILSFSSVVLPGISSRVSPGFPVKSASIFFIVTAFMLLVMWLGRIIPSIFTGGPPVGLEKYTTLVIQAMDLAIIVPVLLISAAGLLRRSPLGYALSSVVVMKGAALFSAVSVMGVIMKLSGIEVSTAELLLFPAATLVNFYFFFRILLSFSPK